MRLWVLRGNDNAIAIYKHLGAKIYTARIEDLNGADAPEFGMEWNDLDSFIEK